MFPGNERDKWQKTIYLPIYPGSYWGIFFPFLLFLRANREVLTPTIKAKREREREGRQTDR